MKKIILFLFFTSACYSQSNSFDAILKAKLDEFKKMPLELEEQRPVMISAIEVIAKSAKDTILKKDAFDYLSIIKTKKLDPIESKNIDLSKLPIEIKSKFELTEDKFNSTHFLHHKKNKDYLKLYIGEKYGNPYLRFVCKYTGKEWVFMKKIIFLVDGAKFEYSPKNIKREVFLGGLYERSDDSVSEDMMPLLNALANAKNEIEIRYEGERIHDQKYNAKSAIAIKETLDFFNSLKSQ